MNDEAPTRPRRPELVAHVALGLLAGGLYVVFDVLSESRIGRGTLTGGLAEAHAIVDHTLPFLVGALFGVSLHYRRLRARLAAAEGAEARAEALRTRLSRVERDQAVWVLAAAVLHELNNPLHALGLLLDELAASEGSVPRGEGGTQRSNLVERARAQSDRALAQLGLLRSMRSLGEPDMQWIGLERMVAALASDVESIAREDGLEVRLECAEAVSVKGDPTYVRTILENLLDNSLHALRARGGGRITIRLGAESGHAVIRVCDDGPPLDAGVRSTLFEPLGTTRTQGLGLGLPIARALARAMRGDLSFEDSDEKAFRLELPLGSP